MTDVRQQVARTVVPSRLAVTVTTAYSMTTADRVVRVDASAGAVTVTLPPALGVVGELLRILKVDTSANVVTIQTQGPDTIGSAAATSVTLTLADQVKTLRAWRNGNSTNYDDVAPLVGNASTATKLATSRTINGVAFDGTANVTVPAAAGTLTGGTLAAGVTASSLTSVGTLSALAVTGAASVGPLTITGAGSKAVFPTGAGSFGDPLGLNTDSAGDKAVWYNDAGASYDGRLGVGPLSNLWLKSIATGATTSSIDFHVGNVTNGVTKQLSISRTSVAIAGPVGVNGATPPTKPTITGSRSGATAAVLAQVLTALAAMGVLTDSTTA